MSAGLQHYIAAIDQLLGLPAERDRALAAAQQAGRAELDSALIEQRRLRETSDQVARLVDEASDRLRRLESRTGHLEARPATDTPGDLSAVPRYAEGLLRDLEGAANAQEWVDRARAQAHRVAEETARFVPPTAPAQPQPEVASPSAPASRAAPASRRFALIAAAVAILMIIVVVLLTLPH